MCMHDDLMDEGAVSLIRQHGHIQTLYMAMAGFVLRLSDNIICVY